MGHDITNLPAQRTTWTRGECAWCAAYDRPLRLCGSCRQVAYCDADCQHSDWSNTHKEMCEALSRMEEDAESDEGGAPLIFVSLTHGGYACPGKKRPEGVPTNFGLYQAVEKYFRVRRSDETYTENFRVSEVEFRALWKDLADNMHEWVSFFQHLENSRHFVTTFNALYVLADTYMTRGFYADCSEVLEWWKDNAAKFAAFYKQHAAECGDDQLTTHVSQFEGFTYYNDLTRLQLNLREGKFRDSVAIFRDVCVYESRDASEFPEFMRDSNKRPNLARLQKNRKVSLRDGIPSGDEVRAIAPKVLLKCMKKYKEKMLYKEKLLECANADCNRKEKTVCEFKICQRCREDVYCSRECQRSSWSSHRKTCGKWCATRLK